MKVKKEVWVEVCDFCGEPKDYTCNLCGKDLCSKHTLHLSTQHSEVGVIIYVGDTLVTCFCPEHLSEELKKKHDGYLTKSRETKTPS